MSIIRIGSDYLINTHHVETTIMIAVYLRRYRSYMDHWVNERDSNI